MSLLSTSKELFFIIERSSSESTLLQPPEVLRASFSAYLTRSQVSRKNLSLPSSFSAHLQRKLRYNCSSSIILSCW
eukprot:scaffold2698_cov135-Skeletonema_dohrnii-CCMP3373.AAC.3